MSNNIAALIQTFIVRSDTVGGADAVVIMHSDLYFRAKPKKHGGKSGIDNPGVIVYICEVVANQPDPTKPLRGSKTRLAYSDITAVSDASLATRVAFNIPVRVTTDTQYGLAVVFEDPDYQLWENVQGDFLVGTQQKSSGAAGLNSSDGSLYEYTTSEIVTPLVDTNLKFSIAAAQLTANTLTIDLVNGDFEFINITSSNTSLFHGGERVYQLFGKPSANVFMNQPGTIALSKGNTVVVGTNTTFTTTFTTGDYIVMTDYSDANTFINRIAYVHNDRKLALVNAPKHNFNTLNYYKSVTAQVYNHDFIKSLLVLDNSTANSSMLFSDSSLDITNYVNGSGYSNSDYITISGGSINATANIVTNGSGAIKSINFTNVGLGFANATVANVIISNSSGHNSAGTGASLTINVGGKILGETSHAKANVVSVTDQPVHQFDSEILTIAGSTTSVNIQYDFAFTNTTSNTTLVDIDQFAPDFNPGINSLYTYPAIVMSKSHEVLSANNLLYGDDKKSMVFQVTLNTNQAVSNSLFATPLLYGGKADIFTFKNEINNNINNEFMPHGGQAQCKHISTAISFANTAEDMIVYLDAWKPFGTDFAVYGKIWNQHDSDAFDDKYWSPMLQVNPNTNVFSSLADESDTVTYTYQLPQVPASLNTITGSITATTGQANITGFGTAFNTDLTVGNLFKLYDPNQPNVNYWIGVVNSITNSTFFTADVAINNSSLNGSGFAIDNLLYNYTAFNNINNDNVVRYYSSTASPVDGFDTMAVKIVLLSSNNYIAPIIHDIRALGVSA